MTIRELQRQAYVVELAYKRASVEMKVEGYGKLTGILRGLTDADGGGVTSADDLRTVRVLLSTEDGRYRIALPRITEIAEVA